MHSSRLAVPAFLLGALATPLSLYWRDAGAAAVSDRDVARRLSAAMQDVAAQVGPSVVSVESFAGRAGTLRGSGVLLSEEGLIVTNRHVIDGAQNHRVRLSDGRELRARLVGSDADTDLAVLDVEGDGYPTASLSPDSPPAVGTFVMAFGNPLGLDHTVTSGIVSARGRALQIATYEDFIQTDAAINNGNSGGPLVDLDGRVIGITTAKEWTTRGNQGLGFAIPAYMVREVVDDIVAKGYVERGFFGFQLRTLGAGWARQQGLDPRPYVSVKEIEPNTPADLAGFREGDVVLAVGQQPIADQRTLFASIARLDPGSKVAVDVWREGAKQTLLVEVGMRPR